MKYFYIWVVIAGLLAASADLRAAEVYTWTDENGNLHITQDPPHKRPHLKIR